MSRRGSNRIDRVAQMSMQEEIIAKRKLELLEKQKTVELAKQVQAAQSGGKSSKKETRAITHKVSVVVEEPPPPKNNFSNDGSFFENFKKITEAAKKAQEIASAQENAAVTQVDDQNTDDSANISDSIIAELIQGPPPPPPLPESEKALPPPPALPELIDTIATEQNTITVNNNSSTDNKDKKQDNRSHDSLNPQDLNSQENQFSSQSNITSTTHSDANRRETKYTNNNQDNRPKKTTSRFSNPPTATKIPSLLDLPSENPFANNEMTSNRAVDSFFHNDDTPANNTIAKSEQNRFSQNQSNRFTNDQGSQNNKFSDGTKFSKDPSFGYRFGDNKSTNRNKNSQDPSNNNSRFNDEQSVANKFPSNSSGIRDNFGHDSQDRFMSNKTPNFPNNSNRFAPDQVSNKFPPNISQLNRFAQEQPKSSNSNSQESFAFGQQTIGNNDPSINQFPKDQDDRIMPNATFQQNRFAPPDVSKSFNNPFAPQNAPNKLMTDEPSNVSIHDFGNNFHGNDVKVTKENDSVKHPFGDNHLFVQNQTPNNFIMNTPPPTEQRNLFQNQSINRFANTTQPDSCLDGFGRVTARYDDFQNAFPRSNFNVPPISQSNNFIPSQPNLQQPPPNFPLNNQSTNIVSPFNNSAFGMNFTTPPPMTTAMNPMLHTIPQPLPLSLNKIPPPKDLDLNAIPEPKMNMDATKFAPSTDNDFIPTSIDALVALVAENDEYEDKLCSRKIDMHSSLWFLSEKNSLAYRNYRQKVQELRAKLEKSQNDKYDPLEIDYKDDEIDDPQPFDTNQSQSNDYDSDSEYLHDTKERNFNNMKRKLDSRSKDYYSSDSEDHERFHERFREPDDKPFKPDKDSESDSHSQRGQKKSRWGDKVDIISTPAPQPLMSLSIPAVGSIPTSFGNQQKPILSSIKRTEPALLNYARQNYGSIDLSEEDWKKCEDHFKVNLLYQDMLKKRQEIDRMARSGRFKYEYDSDEDVDGGTWEHKMRNSEMEATSRWAEALNKQAEGKHHIGDFLPPEELKKFMEKYDSKLNNREPDISDYKEYKLKEDNIGFQMLQKLGWKQGEGLRPDGIVDPVNKAQPRDSNQGLGAMQPSEMQSSDNEYDAYRKRMMLAYRFRPNPLNNPRRAYY